MPALAIAAMEIVPLNIPLRVPFGIAGGAQPAAENVLVRLTLNDGTVGYGEAAPLPPYNGETQTLALSVLHASGAEAIGQTVHDWRSVAADFQRRGGIRCGSAQCAFETALLDAITRAQGKSLLQFFGGASNELRTDLTITTGTAAAAGAAAREIAARGFRTIKVKIGGIEGPRHDLARVLAVREHAPTAALVLDGNARLTRADARELLRGLRAHGVEPALLEQWLSADDFEGMRELHEATGWLVAADESVSTAADLERVLAARAAQVVNIKLMKAGIAVALDVAAMAESAGLQLMIGGNVETILAMTASACFAAGWGGFSFADLDTPLFLAENPFTGGYDLTADRISLSHIRAGHGVVPR